MTTDSRPAVFATQCLLSGIQDCLNTASLLGADSEPASNSHRCVCYEQKGESVAMKLEPTNATEASRLYGRHFDHKASDFAHHLLYFLGGQGAHVCAYGWRHALKPLLSADHIAATCRPACTCVCSMYLAAG